MDYLMTTLSTSTFKFQLFVNDFEEFCLFHDLKFTLILVWFPWVIPISSAYFFSNYFNIIICLIILISSSWRVFFSCSILNYINIVININVIVKLNYIFLIIIKKKFWLKEKWQNNLNKIVKSFFGIYT